LTMNLVILRNYRAQSGRRRGNASAGNDDADEDGVAPAQQTEFPAAQAGFRFLRS